MLESLALVYQLNQPPSFDSQAAVYNALSSPNAAVYSGGPKPLETRLQAQAGNAQTFSLGQAKKNLSRPYLNPETNGYAVTYSDFVSRGRIISRALDNFSDKELRQIPIDEYLTRVSDFQIAYIGGQFRLFGDDLKLMFDNITLLLRDPSAAETRARDYLKASRQKEKEIDMREQMFHFLSGLESEIRQKRHEIIMRNLDRSLEAIKRLLIER